MAISAKLVKELRERTGAGMMDCKKALVETDGDIEQAEEHLQKKGLSKAAKKADRVAAEGVVEALANDEHTEAVLVEVNSETDFVARNEDFKKFTALVVEHTLNEGIDSAEALLDSDIDGKSVEDRRKALIATIGENITVRRVVRAEVEGNGVIGDYVHNGNIGVLVTLEASDDVSGNDDAYELARDIAMHAAAMNPEYARQEDIDEDALKAQEQVEIDKAMESGKPEEIAKKMVQGRMRKWKEQICLVDQPFVKNSDLTVGEEIERVSDEIGTDLKLVGFERLVRGEGIEKDEANLADEVASALK